MYRSGVFWAAAFAVAAGWPAANTYAADDGRLAIELNKLETSGEHCRAWLLLENDTRIDFRDLRLDLVVFDPDGIIAQRLATDAPELDAGRTAVHVTTLRDTACKAVDRILLNGFLRCGDADGTREDCDTHVETRSAAAVPFVH